MKHFNTFLVFLFLLASFSSFAAVTPHAHKARENYPVENKYLEASNSLEEFLNLTPKKIKEQTGEKLSLKEVMALKTAQRKVKKLQADDGTGERGSKSQLVALLLAIFLGALGIHRFYLGYVGIGILQLLTAGGCGIWALIDIILIATGNLQPKYGYYDEEL
ncbi:MAG: TM2 domain-containing protein [Bacteroidota bacterium]